MPSIEIGGEEIIELIEIPAYDLTPPMYGHGTAKNKSSPKRYTGSVLYGALVISGGQQFNILPSIALDEKEVIVV